jgi:transcriptional regulator with XRE-family HTH domain
MVAKTKARRAKTARGVGSATAKQVPAGQAVCARLRALRIQRDFSQGEIEGRTGLLRCYVSRVENGHTVPSIETLEKFAAALSVPLYQLFYEGDKPPDTVSFPIPPSLEEQARLDGTSGLDARFLLKIKNLVGKIPESDRDVLLTLARKLAFR